MKSKINILEDTINKIKEEDNERNKKVQAIFKEFLKPSQILANL